MRPDEAAAALDSRGQAEIEGRAGSGATDAPMPGAGRDAAPAPPPAGPHDAAELTDPAATPGSGALPAGSPDDEADAATC